MLPIEQKIEPPHALTQPQQKGIWAGNALAAVGLLSLVVAPSISISALSMAVLISGLALEPSMGLALLGVSLPFYLHPKQFGTMDFSYPEIILISTLLGTVLHTAFSLRTGKRGSVAELATPMDGPIALLLGAALLSLLASEVLRVSLRELRTVVLEPVVAYYLTVWLIPSRKQLVRVIAALLVGGVLVALFGLYQYLFTDQVTAVQGVRRIQGPYASPNNLGLYLDRLLPIALALALFLPRATYRTAKLISGILMAPIAAALLLTFSLGSWLASALGVLVVTFLWRMRSGVLLAAVYAAVTAAGVPLLRLDRISSHFSLTRGTSFIRVQLWESSLHMIRDHPLLGVGMDNFLYQYRSHYLLPTAAAEPNLSHPHNILLDFWLRLGIAGVAALIWIAVTLVQIWRQAWMRSSDPVDRALLAGMAGAAIDLVAHGMVDNSYFLVDLAFQFWLCVAGAVLIWGRLSPQSRIE